MRQDLRHAIRLLVQNKGWTLVVVVSIALGIGANTALFGAVNGLLFKPLGVANQIVPRESSRIAATVFDSNPLALV